MVFGDRIDESIKNHASIMDALVEALENLSIPTITIEYPLEIGRESMKSIVTFAYTFNGIGIDYSRPTGVVSYLQVWKI